MVSSCILYLDRSPFVLYGHHIHHSMCYHNNSLIRHQQLVGIKVDTVSHWVRISRTKFTENNLYVVCGEQTFTVGFLNRINLWIINWEDAL